MLVFIGKAKEPLIPIGILVVHGTTNAPIFRGESPLSVHMLKSYAEGFRFYQQNEINGRPDEIICKANDPKNFVDFGTKYYSLAEIDIFKKEDCFIDLAAKIIIVGESKYSLIEL